jgi:hypothetical protein
MAKSQGYTNLRAVSGALNVCSLASYAALSPSSRQCCNVTCGFAANTR